MAGLTLSALALLLPPGRIPSLAGALTGEIAKADFRTWTTNHGGVWLNFNNLLSGTPVKDQWSVRHGVRFATVRGPDGEPLPPGVPVVASASYAYNLGRITLVGSRARSTYDDKASEYEVRFASPQRWAGIHRYWRGATLTRFFNPAGDILHEARGDGFQAWFAESGETNFWVSRIEISGEVREGVRQVGHSDDLIFGTEPIPRNQLYLSIRSVTAGALQSSAQPQLAVDYRVQRGAGTNEAILTTNGFLSTGGPSGAGLSTNIGIYLDRD